MSLPTGNLFSFERQSLLTRIRGKLTWLAAWPLLLGTVLRGWLPRPLRRHTPRELWIGDSHAMTFNRSILNGQFMTAPEGQLILRTGARLMYSLGQKGFPPQVLRVVGVIARFGRRGAFLPVFSAGEIDVRNHLGLKLDLPFDFVDAYVDRCLALGALIKAEKVAFIVPVPPVDMTPEDSWFPLAGTLEQRLEAHRRLRARLAGRVAREPGAILLDFTDVLADETGAMPPAYTVDGCHITAEQVDWVRGRIRNENLLS